MNKIGTLQGEAVIKDKDGNIKGRILFSSDSVSEESYKKIKQTGDKHNGNNTHNNRP